MALHPLVEMLKCVHLAHWYLSASAAFSAWLHDVASGAWRFFLLQPARQSLARADFCFRQFSFFLARMFGS